MTISSNLTASTKASWTSSRASRQLGASYSNSDCIQVMGGQRLSETRLREDTIDSSPCYRPSRPCSRQKTITHLHVLRACRRY